MATREGERSGEEEKRGRRKKGGGGGGEVLVIWAYIHEYKWKDIVKSMDICCRRYIVCISAVACLLI